MYAEDIDEFNMFLRQQPETIRNAVRHMHKRAIFFASTEIGDMLMGMIHSFKFYVNKQTILICAIVFC